MLNLTSTSDIIQLITDTASDIEVHASWVDLNGTTVTPGRTNNASITTATTTTIVSSPAASTQRNAKSIIIHNNHATASCGVRAVHNDGTTTAELVHATLAPTESILFMEGLGWNKINSRGEVIITSPGQTIYATQNPSGMKSYTAADATGYWYGTWKDTGFPAAWAPGTPGLNGRNTDGTTTTDAGCFPITDAGTGTNRLTRFTAFSNSISMFNVLADVVWVNSGLVITTTTAQAITTPTFPARDDNGATAGVGYRIGIMCTAAVGLAAVANNATVTYTNSSGTGSRTATLTAVIGSQAPATPVIGTVIWFNLQAGDVGVQSIQSVTLGTSWVSGTISLFVARWISTVACVANVPAIATTYGLGVPLYNGTCLLHFHQANGTGTGTVAIEMTVEAK